MILQILPHHYTKMTKKEAKKIAQNAVGCSIDLLRQGDWLQEYSEKEQEKILAELTAIERKFFMYQIKPRI